MKFITVLSFLLIFSCGLIFSQTLPNKPSLSHVRSYNQANLMKIELGFNKEKVLEVMGGLQSIQTYLGSSAWDRSKSLVINNPYSRDLKRGKDSSSIEILWYYTDLKNLDGAINKEELTPIIIEKNLVVGLGWGFYSDYAKKQEITVDVR